MTELAFAVVGARPELYAASPQLSLRVRITAAGGVRVHAITLRAQVRIEPQARRYAGPEPERLVELFGSPDRYGDTLRSLLWAHVSQTVLAFTGETEFDLTLPCSYDFEVAANKYLSALAGGDIPLEVMFSGTLFVRGNSGITAELVPWNCDARYRLPVAVYRQAMDAFFPDSAWIRIDRATFDELYRFKTAGGYPTWERALAQLRAAAESPR